jgi:hypothetical protein
VLQPGLIGAETRLALWARGKQKNAYLVGFLLAVPDDLPDPPPARTDAAEVGEPLAALADAGNACAAQLLRLHTGSGQAFLRTAAEVLRKPGNQDVVNLLLDAVSAYLASVRPEGNPEADLAAVKAEVAALLEAPPPPLLDLIQSLPGLLPEVRAMLVLSRLGYPVVRPVFSRTTAIGSLMRSKLQPITAALLAEIALLRGAVA